MSQICYQWGNANVLWNNANWPWSACSSSSQADCVKWVTANVLWKDANWWWIQCGIQPPVTASVVPIQPTGVDATTLIQPWLIEPWNPYRAGERKKKKKIRLICKINNMVFDEEKESGDRNVTVDDIKMEIGTISNIDLDVKFYV